MSFNESSHSRNCVALLARAITTARGQPFLEDGRASVGGFSLIPRKNVEARCEFASRRNQPKAPSSSLDLAARVRGSVRGHEGVYFVLQVRGEAIGIISDPLDELRAGDAMTLAAAFFQQAGQSLSRRSVMIGFKQTETFTRVCLAVQDPDVLTSR